MEFQMGTRDKRGTGEGEGLQTVSITASPSPPPWDCKMKYFLNERFSFTDKIADEKL